MFSWKNENARNKEELKSQPAAVYLILIWDLSQQLDLPKCIHIACVKNVFPENSLLASGINSICCLMATNIYYGKLTIRSRQKR